MSKFKSSTINAGMNAKTIKGDKLSKYKTAIMYLAPARTVEGVNMCAFARIAKCEAPCLFKAGRGGMSNVELARVNKTIRYRDDRQAFLADLSRDLERFVAYSHKRGELPAVRLNGTSDVQWEVGHPVTRNGVEFDHVFEAFPEVVFYDYTKIVKRVYRTDLPSNYVLVLSYSAANADYAESVLKAQRETGCNVAVVFRSEAVRDHYMETGWNGLRVINGDETDLRFLDPAGVVVGLYAKGPAKKDATGFVVD